MNYKHKFILIDSTSNSSDIELATCSDLMTANFLADHYISVYGNNNEKLSVKYKFGKKKRLS